MTNLAHVIVAALSAFVIGLVINNVALPDAYTKGFEAGYKQGRVDALAPRPTNHELEEVCLSMWIGQQIREQK
jgi:hypothetical protein